MATPKTNNALVAKKTHGLKDYKKMQKNKKHGKRTAAAEKAKTRSISPNAVGFVVPVEVASVQDMSANEVENGTKKKDTICKVSEEQYHDVGCSAYNIVATADSEDKIPTVTMIAPTKVETNESLTKSNNIQMENCSLNSVSADKFDIVAHRKALEAALYENMETPLEMLIRCNFIIPTDTEYHAMIEDDSVEDTESVESLPRAVCLDDNGFEIISPAMHPDTRDGPASEGTWLPLSIDELFARASESKLDENSPAGFSKNHEQDDLEAEKIVVFLPSALQARHRAPISIQQILSGTCSREDMATKLSIGSQPMESIEDGMRAAVQSTPVQPTSSHAPHLNDPAIISHKIKLQAPGKSDTLTTDKDAGDMNDFNLPWPTPVFMRRRGSSSTSTRYSRTSSPLNPNARPYTPPTPYFTSSHLEYQIGYWCPESSYNAYWSYSMDVFPGSSSCYNPHGLSVADSNMTPAMGLRM
ncbi:uncharacterized protein SETTUDRAFT_38795 [Exserohilum turcica Et28A]|uniref:Uncharacterized protein n=1 Tax=Exserohilum turcicum (strain 28A) TaxID=671987 RepID=R0IU31_EXST2|nr:uncharacterized protein SETTUDRAFT_38795 [Exserohilum turcica Et28A]EOA88116.1 hypothetical protein SETTUDRAFT_38795 [Exserohilum turcica Et28A]